MREPIFKGKRCSIFRVSDSTTLHDTTTRPPLSSVVRAGGAQAQSSIADAPVRAPPPPSVSTHHIANQVACELRAASMSTIVCYSQFMVARVSRTRRLELRCSPPRRRGARYPILCHKKDYMIELCCNGSLFPTATILACYFNT